MAFVLRRLTSRGLLSTAACAALAGACVGRGWRAASGPARVARADSLPRYPEILRGAAVEGAADLAVAVDPTGRVPPRGARAVAADHELFAQAARDAVLRWMFRPAMRGGRRAADTVRVRVVFALDSAPPCPPRPPRCAGSLPSGAPGVRAVLDTTQPGATRVRVIACRAWPYATCLPAHAAAGGSAGDV